MTYIPKSKGPEELDFDLRLHANYPNLIRNKLIIVSGASQSGKTTLVRHLIKDYFELYNKSLGSEGCNALKIFCKTADLQNSYDFVDKKYIQTDYSDDDVDLLSLEQSDPKYKNRELLIVFDDVIGMYNVKSNPRFTKILTELRWHHITMIILVHSISIVDKHFTSGITYILFLFEGGTTYDSMKLVMTITKSILKRSILEKMINDAIRLEKFVCVSFLCDSSSHDFFPKSCGSPYIFKLPESILSRQFLIC